ncbi:signal recognition particle 14 kDa protein-like [Panonychus citri]|uniref:signal recognition particle 14 kDa protein-like n=1 Tax=Panonychus citri TaxID=50023 RepID=UPI0023070E58|nr:signal recognition particle 14 kDa protein-like [Panonychus citri]
MNRLENEPFLSELSNMFNIARNNGNSVYITMKRYSGVDKPKSHANKTAASNKDEGSSSTGDHLCLVRAKIGKKKISTVIHSKDINKFQLAYSNLLKGNLYGMQKKK